MLREQGLEDALDLKLRKEHELITTKHYLKGKIAVLI
jgi:hypothetical protein